jgi:ATP dependent DNA ligase domain
MIYVCEWCTGWRPAVKTGRWHRLAATLTQERFAGPGWIFERKPDGIRLLAFRHGRDVRLLSRNKLPQNAVFPEAVEAIARLPVRDVMLDGEATGVWFKQGRLAYHIFDILWIDGRDVTGLPIEERQAVLAKLPLKSPLVRVPSLHDAVPRRRHHQRRTGRLLRSHRPAHADASARSAHYHGALSRRHRRKASFRRMSNLREPQRPNRPVARRPAQVASR